MRTPTAMLITGALLAGLAASGCGNDPAEATGSTATADATGDDVDGLSAGDSAAAADCGEPCDAAADDTDGGSAASGSDAADASASGACPQAGHFLDLATAKGAGAGYAKPTLAVSCVGDDVVVQSNTIPHYSFVAMTPNPLVAVANTYHFARAPKAAAQTTPIPLLGRIGVAVNGMPLFGPNEAAQPAESAWGDPVYNQITDGCRGHTAAEYHYHALEQRCLTMTAMVAEPWKLTVDASKPSPPLGYALDGFAIYGPYECKDAACSAVIELKSGYDQVADPKKDAWDAYAFANSADPQRLDACNGHTGPAGDYHYHATAAFPYILGCYRGTPSADSGLDGNGGGGGGGGPGDLTPCTAEVDCGAQSCGAAATSGCTCQQTPEGKRCVPKCKTSADCPVGGPQALVCTPQGFCAPAMGG